MIASPVLDLHGLMHHFDEYWTPQTGRDLIEAVFPGRFYSLGTYPVRYQYINQRIENAIFYSPHKELPTLELYFDVTTYEVLAYRHTYILEGKPCSDFSPITNEYLSFVIGIAKLDALFIHAKKQWDRMVLLFLVGTVLALFNFHLWPYFIIGALFFLAWAWVQRLRMMYIRLNLK